MRRNSDKKSGRKYRHFRLELIMALILLSACGKTGDTAEESSQSQSLSIQSTEADVLEEAFGMPAGGDNVDGKEASFYENAYEAYSTKCQELSKMYGSGRLVEHTADTGGWKSGCCYMSGLCFVDLINFNGSEVKDLLVVYSRGDNGGVNSRGLEIPQAGNYCIEVWTYEEGALKLLVSADHVSSYLNFRNEYWDTDNCFLTVYESEYDKTAVIQIYEESPEGDVYTNYDCLTHYDGYELQCNIYTSKYGKFYENGEEIDWLYYCYRTCDYNTILASVQLSSSEYVKDGLAEFGVDMSYGIARSMENMQGLSGETFQTMMKVSGEYFGAYMQTMLDIRRNTFEEGFGSREPGFTLYDMDGNGVPELIVDIAPSEAGAMCQVYTCVGDQAVQCGEGLSGDSTFYMGPGGGLVRTEGHMDLYHYEKWDLQGTELVITEFAGGTAEPEKGYPPLDDYGYQAYDKEVRFWNGDLSTLLYLSGLDALESLQKFEETVSAAADTDYQYVYEDLDHDGEKEFLALIGEGEIWYCGNDGSQCELVYVPEHRLECYTLKILRQKDETHVVVNAYNSMGNYQYYSILALKDGKVQSLVSDHIGYVYENGEGDIVLDIQSYDGRYEADWGIFTTHTWKDTYLYYDGETYREYAAAVLTEEEFLKCYDNASGVLDKIRQSTELAEGESLELTSFFVRGNGIVQIQCEHRFADGSIAFFYYELKSDENNMLSGGEALNYGQMYETLSQLEAVYPVLPE